MTYSYFPGCTLKTKAKDLDHYARISAEALGFTLEELPDWQCCGGVYPMAKNEIATKLSSIRARAASPSKKGFNCFADRKSTRLNSSHWNKSRMPSSA